MVFSLKHLFLFVTFAAVTSAVAAWRYNSVPWADYDVSPAFRIFSSLICGLMVTILPILIVWLLFRTWQTGGPHS